MARHIAKSLVANDHGTEALVQLSYAIGQIQPFSISVKSNSIASEEFIIDKIRETFDLSPRGIIEYLKLNDSNVIKYKNIASGGHFLNVDAPWEQIKVF
jgi:S-adenosylmethionine synthetase